MRLSCLVSVFLAILFEADGAGRSLRSWEPVAADQPESIASFVSLVKMDSVLPAPAPLAAAPAMAPGPSPLGAPAPAPLASPAASPAMIVAASPFGGEEVPADEPAFTKRMVGVDYYLLSANPNLKESYEIAVKTVLATEVGNDLTPGDVTLRLTPGSVIIESWFANPKSLPSLTKKGIRKNLCRNSNIDNELQAAVSKLPGFQEVTTHEVSLDRAVQCAPQQQTASQPKAVPSEEKKPHPTQNTNDGNCFPACMEGRGVCGDQVCFCKHPYTGAQCEQELEEQVFRLNWMYVTLILCFVAGLGMCLAEGVWRACKAATKQQEENKRILTGHKEVWQTGPAT